MPHRGRLLLAGALSALLLACQSASTTPTGAAAAPATAAPTTKAGSPVVATKPAASLGSAASGNAPTGSASPAVAAAKPAAQPPAARQAGVTVPRISLQELPFGFQQPLFLTHAGDGSGRQFVVEKGGLIRVIKDDQVLPTPYIDLTSRIRSSGSEQGLLGLAFHPRYTENGRFFVGYTDGEGRNTVERFQVSAANPDQGDPGTGVILLAIDDPAANHNGGMVEFGPDGYLWVGTGDGGGAGDRYRNGQNTQTLLGKMLRLDVDSAEPYGIPTDNPYVGNAEYRPEIWAMGLRNPWRYSFDRGTGDLWIADVGQNAYEEINRVPAATAGGLNFGWPLTEGQHCFPAAASCDTTAFTQPVAEYGRDGGCSVSGGYVYRGAASPSLDGLYFFGDFCTGRIWSLDSTDGASWRMTEQLKDALQISSFGQDEAGEVYVTTFSGPNASSHRIYRIVAQ